MVIIQIMEPKWHYFGPGPQMVIIQIMEQGVYHLKQNNENPIIII